MRATLAGGRSLLAAIDEPDAGRDADASTSLLRFPALEVVRERPSEPSPLFTRHMLGVIEAERDSRRQRRERGAVVYRGAPRERARKADAVAQARMDMDRWVDEGGMVPFEAAAMLRALPAGR
jgi:hypothetical protein